MDRPRPGNAQPAARRPAIRSTRRRLTGWSGPRLRRFRPSP